MLFAGTNLVENIMDNLLVKVSYLFTILYTFILIKLLLHVTLLFMFGYFAWFTIEMLAVIFCN